MAPPAKGIRGVGKAAGKAKPTKKAPVTGKAAIQATAASASRSRVFVKHAKEATALADGVRLSNGVVMPVVGFGTYKLKKGEAAKPVADALKVGYRLIDTAAVYENEGDVGKALRESGIPRSEVFIETKHWRSSHGYDRTMKLFKQSLRKLGVDYIDLYMIHWPGCKTGWPLKAGTMCPPDWTPAMRDTGTWKAMEELYNEGKIKSLGVCNYSIRHLQQLLKTCKVKPMVNQVEFHPLCLQKELLEFCKAEGIILQAYASLGSGDAAQAQSFFQLTPVQVAAEAHGVTSAQVLLRWAMEKGAVVIPKSARAERMQENSGVFGFNLTAKEVSAIDKLNSGTRFAWKGLDPDTVK
eukprot:TRINITY_DN63521_c0_g1_i1.p1 TRINITY_DN63521_c0_g1~~TRINITY_DN63521_c0_g1_i1.p1  ORF type:complete len:376 (-),score=81.69 TRINITY_DN63521_c0_g1_i1:39-1097(-)